MTTRAIRVVAGAVEKVKIKGKTEIKRRFLPVLQTANSSASRKNQVASHM